MIAPHPLPRDVNHGNHYLFRSVSPTQICSGICASISCENQKHHREDEGTRDRNHCGERRKNPSSGKSKRTATCPLLSGQSQSQLVNQSTLGKVSSPLVKQIIFSMWFLFRNPKLPNRGKNHLAAVHRRPDNFWKYSRITTLIGIQQFIQNHTKFRISIIIKLIDV